MTQDKPTSEKSSTQHKNSLEQHEVKEVLGFLKRYGSLIGTGILAAALTLIGSTLYSQRQAEKRVTAEEQLLRAQTPQQIEEALNKYKSAPSAPVALLNLAKIYYNQGDAAQARTQYERFLKDYKNSDMRPFAMLGLAYCTEADGKLNEAASQFADIAEKNPSSVVYPVAVLGKARCLSQVGQVDEARVALEDFLVANPSSAMAGPVNAALTELGKKN